MSDQGECLTPRTKWIEGTCYRKPFSQGDNDDLSGAVGDTEDKYGDTLESHDDTFESEADLELARKIREKSPGSFQLSFHIPSQLFGAVLGQKGSTKQRIERNTNTRIDIPRSEADIVISGQSKMSIIRAHNQIQEIATKRRSTLARKLTHFINVPIQCQVT